MTWSSSRFNYGLINMILVRITQLHINSKTGIDLLCVCIFIMCAHVNVFASLQTQTFQTQWWSLNYSPTVWDLLFMSGKKSFITLISETHTHTHKLYLLYLLSALPTTANLSSLQSHSLFLPFHAFFPSFSLFTSSALAMPLISSRYWGVQSTKGQF